MFYVGILSLYLQLLNTIKGFINIQHQTNENKIKQGIRREENDSQTNSSLNTKANQQIFS